MFVPYILDVSNCLAPKSPEVSLPQAAPSPFHKFYKHMRQHYYKSNGGSGRGVAKCMFPEVTKLFSLFYYQLMGFVNSILALPFWYPSKQVNSHTVRNFATYAAFINNIKCLSSGQCDTISLFLSFFPFCFLVSRRLSVG